MTFKDPLFANYDNYDLFLFESFYQGAAKHYREFPEKFPAKVHWRLFEFICSRIETAEKSLPGSRNDAPEERWRYVSDKFLIHFALQENKKNAFRVSPLVSYLMITKAIPASDETKETIERWRSSEAYQKGDFVYCYWFPKIIQFAASAANML